MLKKTFLLFLLLFSCAAVRAQVIKGVVRGVTGEALPFSKIWVKNSSHGTVANGKGEFQLDMKGLGSYPLVVSAPGFSQLDTLLEIAEGIIELDVRLLEYIVELGEVQVVALDKRARGKAIMQEVIDRRKDFLEASGRYSCRTYCFTSLDKKAIVHPDSLIVHGDTNLYSLKKANVNEWVSRSYYDQPGRYKDVFEGFTDYSEKVNNTVSVSISFESNEMGPPKTTIETNPYLFVNGLQDADINIFKNTIDVPALCQKPLISPLAYNAFLYYNFYLEQTFDEGGETIYEIRVSPIFKEEALFTGTLFIQDRSMAPISYELGINPSAMPYFKEMRIICSYENMEGRWLPVEREFIYLIKEGRQAIHGKISLAHSDYHFDYDDSPREFWLATRSYAPEAFDRDTAFWQSERPFRLKESDLAFIHAQDSLQRYHESEEYLREQDSTYNTLNVWDFLFNGVGFRNTFKKQSIYFNPLITQMIVFGVGGYRHGLTMTYEKEFASGRSISLSPHLNYGFRNEDLKGSLEFSYTYNPKRFSEVGFFVGDTYDMVNSYESIQGTLAPANRVRNQKVRLDHYFEIVNGLYLGTRFTYSLRRDIGALDYPAWAAIFGSFQQVTPFETYPVFLSEFELSYRIQQKYILKGNKKVIVAAKWPLLSLSYKKGLPKLFNTQADFDFLSFTVDDEISLAALGTSEFKLNAGAFLQKSNLRIIEHKYFRTSDRIFFSDPTRSLQRLDTSLNTSNNFLQANFIHHFKGFFLNKIWLLNKLRLEETFGGSALLIPSAHFRQVEFYAGLDRTFRIKKQLFKIGVYAVAVDNNLSSAALHYKIGINFYDSFRGKWSY